MYWPFPLGIFHKGRPPGGGRGSAPHCRQGGRRWTGGGREKWTSIHPTLSEWPKNRKIRKISEKFSSNPRLCFRSISKKFSGFVGFFLKNPEKTRHFFRKRPKTNAWVGGEFFRRFFEIFRFFSEKLSKKFEIFRFFSVIHCNTYVWNEHLIRLQVLLDDCNLEEESDEWTRRSFVQIAARA